MAGRCGPGRRAATRLLPGVDDGADGPSSAPSVRRRLEPATLAHRTRHDRVDFSGQRRFTALGTPAPGPANTAREHLEEQHTDRKQIGVVPRLPRPPSAVIRLRASGPAGSASPPARPTSAIFAFPFGVTIDLVGRDGSVHDVGRMRLGKRIGDLAGQVDGPPRIQRRAADQRSSTSGPERIRTRGRCGSPPHPLHRAWRCSDARERQRCERRARNCARRSAVEVIRSATIVTATVRPTRVSRAR